MLAHSASPSDIILNLAERLSSELTLKDARRAVALVRTTVGSSQSLALIDTEPDLG